MNFKRITKSLKSGESQRKKDILGLRYDALNTNGTVCELETQILLAGNLDLIEKAELAILKKDIPEIERMSKALIKSIEKIFLNPWTLFSN